MKHAKNPSSCPFDEWKNDFKIPTLENAKFQSSGPCDLRQEDVFDYFLFVLTIDLLGIHILWVSFKECCCKVLSTSRQCYRRRCHLSKVLAAEKRQQNLIMPTLYTRKRNKKFFSDTSKHLTVYDFRYFTVFFWTLLS